MPKVSVALDEAEQNDLQRIVIDKDETEALHFVREVIWARVQAARRLGLRSHLEAGQS